MDKLKIFGGFFALLSVILGAIAAHKLKEFLNEDSLKSFELNRYPGTKICAS